MEKQFWNYVGQGVRYIELYPDYVFLASVIGILVILLILALRMKSRGKMVSQLDQRMADAVCEVIDTWYLDGKITGKQRKKLYAEFSRRLQLSDLSKRKKVLSLGLINWRKAQSRKRITINRALADGKVVPIPGGAPAQITEKRKGSFLTKKNVVA